MIGETHLNTAIVVLAAGKGSRMNCSTPKVMQKLGDRSLLHRVLATALSLNPGQIVLVLAEDQQDIRNAVSEDFSYDLSFAVQVQQRGTGDAVRCAVDQFQDDIETVLVLYADVPLIDGEALARMLKMAEPGSRGHGPGSDRHAVVLMAAECDSIYNTYGRIIHDDDGQIQEIVEYRDCAPWQREILRVSSGVMVLPRKPLQAWLNRLEPCNEQGEYYLTDVVAMARSESIPVLEIQVSEDEIQGANTMLDLARLERIHSRRWAETLLDKGVRISDPDRFDCRGELICGRDVCIDINCIFEGRVELADGVHIGAGCILKNCLIGADTEILPCTFMEGARVGQRTRIGPFARIRPETTLEDEARIGNFVEVKNSALRQGVKASHLSYIGDSDIGTRANVGAGAVTCNYDGVNKNRTVVGSGAFVGSGSMLIAPVQIGDGAIVGAGTVVREDVPSDCLVVDRSEQKKRAGYARLYWNKKKGGRRG